jgi:hypothetical protein
VDGRSGGGTAPHYRALLHAEVGAQVTIASDMGLIDAATVTRMIDQTDHIRRMIRRLMQHMAPSG